MQENTTCAEHFCEKTEMFDALMNSTPDFIYFKDLGGKYVSVSSMFATYLNRTVSEMIGKTDFVFFSQDHAQMRFLEEKLIIETGVAVKNKIEKGICTDGSEVWMSVTRSPWQDNAGKILGIICVCKDVTESINKEKHILDMLSIATHDMRGPLSSIGSMVKLLARGSFGVIDESVKVTLLDVSERIIRLEQLLSEYLLKSSLMNVEMPEKEKLDLRQDIIDPILAEYFSEIEENRIRIDNRLGAIPGNKVIIKANARWIKIVYRNLIRNAIRYASSGHIAFGFEDMGDHYKLNVYNSGPPVPDEMKNNVFEKFESKGGTGLGLAICRNLIQKHGGNMWLENTWDNHPNFIFTIPK